MVPLVSSGLDQERKRLQRLTVVQLNALLDKRGLMTPKRRRLRKSDKVSLITSHMKRPVAKRGSSRNSASQLCPKVMQKNQRLRVIIASLVARLSSQRKTCVRVQKKSRLSQRELSLATNARLLQLLRQSQELAAKGDQEANASLPSGQQCQGMIDALEQIIEMEQKVWDGDGDDVKKIDLGWKLRVLQTHRRVVHGFIQQNWANDMTIQITAHRTLLSSSHFRWFGYVEEIRARSEYNTWWDCVRGTEDLSEQERTQLHETIYLLRQLQYNHLYKESGGPLVLPDWSAARPTKELTRFMRDGMLGKNGLKLVPFPLLLFAAKMSDPKILKSMNELFQRAKIGGELEAKSRQQSICLTSDIPDEKEREQRTTMTHWLLTSLNLYQTQHQYHNARVQQVPKETVQFLKARFAEATKVVQSRYGVRTIESNPETAGEPVSEKKTASLKVKLMTGCMIAAKWSFSLAALLPLVSAIAGEFNAESYKYDLYADYPLPTS